MKKLREVIVDGTPVRVDHDPEWVTVNLLTYTDQDEAATAERESRDLPATSPDNWLENASIRITERGVQVAVSVDDPRGGFQLTVERAPDGEMYLHVPYEAASELHAPIRHLHGGTFEVYEEPTPSFTLRIERGNAAMRHPLDVAWALRDLAERLEQHGSFPGSGIARDVNGNTVGRWEANA